MTLISFLERERESEREKKAGDSRSIFLGLSLVVVKRSHMLT